MERIAWFWLGEMGKGRMFSNALLEVGRAVSSLGNKLGTLETAGLAGQFSEEMYQALRTHQELSAQPRAINI